MELRHYLRMLRAGWWLIALSTLAAFSVALAAAYQATPMYRASARLIVRPNIAAIDNNSLIDSIGTLDKRSIAATYAEVLGSNRLLNETATALQLDAKGLRDYVRTSVVLPDSNILEVAISGPNPDLVTRLANGIGQRGIELAKTLYQAYGLEFIDPAIIPTSPYSPQPLRDASLAVAFGLMIGAALAILREQLRMPLEALRRRNMIDLASSAYTRRFFLRRLEEELARKRGGVLSLGLLQLDGLEGLNETMPAPVFQSLLRRSTRLLQAELRGHDSVGRWGELSFALLLPATPGAAATRTLERIQQALSHPIPLNETVGDETVRLEPRISVVASKDNENSTVLIQRAEKALERTALNGSQPVYFAE